MSVELLAAWITVLGFAWCIFGRFFPYTAHVVEDWLFIKLPHAICSVLKKKPPSSAEKTTGDAKTEIGGNNENVP